MQLVTPPGRWSDDDQPRRRWDQPAWHTNFHRAGRSSIRIHGNAGARKPADWYLPTPPGASRVTTRTLVSSCSGTPPFTVAELGITTAFEVVSLTLVVRTFAKLG